MGMDDGANVVGFGVVGTFVGCEVGTGVAVGAADSVGRKVGAAVGASWSYHVTTSSAKEQDRASISPGQKTRFQMVSTEMKRSFSIHSLLY